MHRDPLQQGPEGLPLLVVKAGQYLILGRAAARRGRRGGPGRGWWPRSAGPAGRPGRGAEAAHGKVRDTHAALAAADQVLLLGAGPVGIELAGEIKAV